jgi:serine phosphatase RsbU (regulator of sigma subunit)/CRP-like cAMP-binding protein
MLTTTAEIAASSLVLTTEELRVISEYAGARVFPKDTIIVKESVRIDSLYIVLEGRVKVFLVGPEGKEVVVSVHGAGEYFGRIGSDEMPMPASVMTVEPSRLILLSKDDLKILLTRNNLFAGRVFEKLVHQVERQSRELSEALQHRTSISEILQAISSSPTNVQAVLDTVAENAGRLCDFTNADILQVEGDELRLVTKYGMDQIWPIGFKIPINRNWVVGRAVADRTSIHVHDLQQAEAEFPVGAGYAKQHGHRTVFATPLLLKGVAIGVILIRRLEVRPLTDNQITLLKTFADQAAIAIENVRLFKEIKKKSRKLKTQAKKLAEFNATLETRVATQIAELKQFAKLEHEILLASEIQKSMLPRSIPRLQGYEFCARMIPAKSVGGDFFDFIPMGSDSLGIAVGDVSDKGVAAALFMAMVRSLLRAEAHPDKSPAEVLRRVNRHLLDMNDNEMFVTVLFGLLNRTTHQFQYARAGHEAPIFIDELGAVKLLPIASGQALGVFDEINLDEQTVALSKGCMLLLYSDGIPDTTNLRNERFGLKGIVRTLSDRQQSPAQKTCGEIINAVNKHQRGSLQHDDMTIVLVRAV